MKGQRRCMWCGKRFIRRKPGRPNIYCSSEHRRAREKAERAFGKSEIERQRISIASLRAFWKRYLEQGS
jgi:hypothetical protein